MNRLINKQTEVNQSVPNVPTASRQPGDQPHGGTSLTTSSDDKSGRTRNPVNIGDTQHDQLAEIEG